ncbi:hypothetical protein HK102_007967 [Quaeritorhiza haematococci]|nr:hypothetical protein HK102_007967 [Quaeritorhiza haematococci]
MEACFALAKCGKAQLDWIGLTQLLKIYRDLFCVPTIGLNPSVYLPRCNDFSVLQTYYLQKTLPLAAAKVKNNEGLTPSEVRRFLLQLLKYNNNSGNKYSDNYFASALLQALGEAFLPAPSKSLTDLWKAPDTTAPRDATDSSGGVFVEEFNFDDGHKSEQLFAQTYIGKEEDVQLFHEAVVEVQRYRSLDMLLPSYHNTVTVSCLETLLKWMMAGLIPTDLNLYLAHSRYGHFLQVRLVSIDALFLLNGLTNEDVLRYVLNLVAYDPIPYVRYYVARSLAEVASIAFGTSKTSLPESTGGTKDEAALNKEKMLFEKIRKQISLLQDVKTVLWDLLNSDALEHRVRVNVLKFCEVVFDVDVTAPPQPVVVGLPKLRIKLPPMMMTAGDEVMFKSYAHVLDCLVISFNICLSKNIQSSSDEEAPPVPAKRIKLVHDAGASSVPERTQPDTPVKPKLDTARLLSADTPTVASPSPISAISPPIADTEPAVQPLDEEFAAEAQNILTKLINHPSAAPFMLPVDINQAPDYYDTIKEPMDLTTAQKRLRMGAYNNDKNNLIQDVRLIFENCFKYNMEESHVCKQAKRLQEFFENEVLAPPKEDKPEAEADDSAMADIQIETPTQPVAPAIDDVVMSPVEATAGTLDVEPERAEEKPPTPPVPSIPMESIVKVDDAVAPVSEPLLSSSEHRRCKKILRKLNGHGVSYWFKQPVDPVAQNIPDYFTVIKHPMDLYTVKSKLESNQYTSLDAFARDVRLIFQNAITYNQAESQAHIDAKTLLAYFENEWAETVKNREATPAPTATDTSRGSSNEKSPISTATTMSEDDVHRCERLLKQCKNDVDQSHRKTMKKKLREGKYGSFEMFEKELNTVRSASRTEKRLASSEPVQRAKSPAKVEPSPANKREQSVEKRPEKRAKSTSKTPEEASMPKPRQATPKPPERTASPQPVLVKKEVIKEKEISQAAPKGLSSNDRKRCMRVLKRLQGTKSALPFLNPVDPIALNIPNYFDVIKHPMDLSTIQRKLEAGEYATPIDCYGDFRLMLNNCFQFNPKGHPVVQEGEVLGQLLEKEWEAAGLPPSSADDTKTQQRSKSKSITPPAADEGATPSSLRRSATPSSSVDRTTSITIQTMLTKLKSHHHAHFFLAPVDGSIYPDYYVKIKNPIDLSTMQSKLDVGAYKTVDEFESDVKQLFANCYTYNAKKTLAYVNGQSLERFFRKEWKTILQTPPKARVREFLNDSPYKDGRMSEMAICKEIHMLLVAHSMSFPFLNPVPRTVPNYHNIIKKPMDFGTIGKRLERGVYKGRDDFRNDYILVFNNARIFNPQGSDIYGMADILEREFESHWKRLFKTEGKPRQSTPPESRPRQSTPPSSSSSKPEKERRKEKESAVPDAKKGKSGKPGDDDGSKGEKPKPKPTISLKLSIKGLKK